jgi:CRP-like cAMP-binding protein
MANKIALPNCMNCTMRRNSIFGNLSNTELETLDYMKDASQYKKGQIVFQEGTHPKGVYCMFSGKVKVYKLGPGYKEQIVRLARNGDVVGYRSLLCRDRYRASAAAIEDSVICSIPREEFFKVLENNAQLSNNLMKLVSNDLASAEKKMVDMMQKPVRERMAEGLILLKEMFGLAEDGKTLNVIMSREDIASFIGTTTETAIRTLSDFNSENIICLYKKEIRIENFSRLLHESHIND